MHIGYICCYTVAIHRKSKSKNESIQQKTEKERQKEKNSRSQRVTESVKMVSCWVKGQNSSRCNWTSWEFDAAHMKRASHIASIGIVKVKIYFLHPSFFLSVFCLFSRVFPVLNNLFFVSLHHCRLLDADQTSSLG